MRKKKVYFLLFFFIKCLERFKGKSWEIEFCHENDRKINSLYMSGIFEEFGV